MVAYRGSAQHVEVLNTKIFILNVAFVEVWVESPVRDHLEGCLKFLLCYLTVCIAVESPVHTVCFGR